MAGAPLAILWPVSWLRPLLRPMIGTGSAKLKMKSALEGRYWKGKL
jgi:hypothetical protein